MNSAELVIENLSWQVGDKTILQDIAFSINKGETLAIVGPNGAGKTSLLKCIYREIQSSQGRVLLHGQDIAQLDRRQIAQQVAVVSQHHDPVFDLTVYDVIHMGLLPHKSLFEVDNSSDQQAIELALNKVDLTDKQNQIFNTLSGGEQQRCLIARAIVQKPNVLIMDEPTNHLDVFYQHQTLQLAKQLNLTLLMTIHDLNLAAQYCDRLLLLNQGKIIACDTPARVLQPSLLKQVFGLDCIVDTNPFNNSLRITFAPAIESIGAAK